jgi:hypothetical protein
MNRVEGQGGPYNQEPTPSEAKRPENNQPTLEVGEGRHGVPPPQSERQPEQGKPQEGQPLPSVWDVVERQARIDEEYSSGQMTREQYYREQREISQFADEVFERGPARDDLILKLYTLLTMELTGPLPIDVTFRDLSLKEVQQFRSRVEPMSDEDIREELRKAEEEHERKTKAYPRPPFPTEGVVFH